MDSATQKAEDLRKQIQATEKELRRLKQQLEDLESSHDIEQPINALSFEDALEQSRWPLSSTEYRRYGRQLILPSIGIQGQLRLKSSSVLIIGAGGLGCPAAAYLSSAGIGLIGLVDGDIVEESNLHRQILHSTSRVGMKKVDSAIAYLRDQNTAIKLKAFPEHLTPQNAESIVKDYDLVLDCTDHPTSRYLISDICVLLRKPLISASALRTDGQLIVLNSPPLPPGNEAGGPCYRCVFPKPPPAESVVSCGEGGILGPVVGVMGVLQALEALKLIAGDKLTGDVENAQQNRTAAGASMLLFSALSNPPFRTVRLKGRRKDCFSCSVCSSLNLESLSSGSLDYVQFCGVASPINIFNSEERVDPTEYIKRRGEQHLLLDVREKVQFDICSLEGSINIPFSTLQGIKAADLPQWLPEALPQDAPIYVVCRLGNDSQLVAKKLLEDGLGRDGRYIGDIKGGLRSWREQVDPSWPDY